jgi:hypothetical protein
MPNPITIRRTVANSGTSVNPAVSDWVARVLANGGATPSVQTQSALSTFANSLAANNLTSHIKVFNAYVPDSFIACQTPFIKGSGNGLWTSYLGNFVGADLSINGLKGSDSKCLLTGVIPSNEITVNNVGLSIYAPILANGSNTIDTGTFNATNTGALLLYAKSFSSHFSVGCWNSAGTDAPTSVSPNLGGFYSFSRVAANDCRTFFGNGSNTLAQQATSATQTGSIVTDFALVDFACNSTSNTPFDFADASHSAWALHDGLDITQTTNLFSAVQALRVAFGGGFI